MTVILVAPPWFMLPWATPRTVAECTEARPGFIGRPGGVVNLWNKCLGADNGTSISRLVRLGLLW